RNRASGVGGDWQGRPQLPVGVGADDPVPPGRPGPAGGPAHRKKKQESEKKQEKKEKKKQEKTPKKKKKK
ncbi:hypothetical protein Q2440_25675, partial [Escherichia coli]|nr:hypothetical protein [Escherichia coli]